ncbi:MAG: hypothetical protein U0Y68_19595 [Blastocatellia bacterium]
MNCHDFKEVLDSYLSDELAVETNHAVLRHAELCGTCRSEMGARRNLRQALRSAVTATTAPPDFKDRLRARLREEATATVPAASPRPGFFSHWFAQLAMPRLALAAATCSLLLMGLLYLVIAPTKSVQAAELSDAILKQATSDHNDCAGIWMSKTYQQDDPVHNAEKFDPRLADLGQYSTHQALGLTFHYAHLCGHHGRKYVHLIYSRNSDLISLFVAERDAAAMKNGVVPQDNGAELQQYLVGQEKATVTAYQTSKRIVLVVSKLSAQENQELAEKLAKPISLHLRTIESTK